MAKKPMVLIGFAEALSAPEVAWSLVDANFEIVAIARRGRRSALRHSLHVAVRAITPPELDARAALVELGQILTDLNPAGDRHIALFPLDDTAIWLWSQLEPRPGRIMIGPEGGNVDLALNKRVQVEFAQAAGFNVPATTVANTSAEVFSRLLDLPVVLRPADAVLPQDGRLRKGRNWICATPAELKAAVREWAEFCPLLIQPFVRGVGEGIFGLATSDGVQAWSGHRRLRMMNPHGSGSSACISQSVPENSKIAVEEFVRRTKWRGLFMVELLREDSGKCWFVEFNGRPWGSMALSRHQGLEYPAWAVQTALEGTPPERAKQHSSTKLVCQNAGREFVHLLFVLRGPRSSGIKSWPRFWHTMHDILRPGVHRRLYNWRRNDWKVFISDCCYTVWSNVSKSKAR